MQAHALLKKEQIQISWQSKQGWLSSAPMHQVGLVTYKLEDAALESAVQD